MGWEIIFLAIIFVGVGIMEYLNFIRLERINAFLLREHKIQEIMMSSNQLMMNSNQQMIKRVLPKIKKR